MDERSTLRRRAVVWGLGLTLIAIVGYRVGRPIAPTVVVRSAMNVEIERRLNRAVNGTGVAAPALLVQPTAPNSVAGASELAPYSSLQPEGRK